MTLTLGRVHHGDCLTLLGELEPESVGFVFADLPYGVTSNAWDVPIDLARFWPAIRRVCRPNACVVMTGVMPFTAHLVLSNEDEFRFSMVWRKNIASGFLNANNRPLRGHEDILVFWREQPPYKPQKTQGHPLVKVTPSKRGENKNSRNYGTESGRLLKTKSYESTERHPTTVLELDCVEQHDPDRRHATQKPDRLIEWFLRSYSEPGDMVLDPKAGSGSTLAAAKSLGRPCIGFDLDPEAVRKANDALASRLDFAG